MSIMIGFAAFVLGNFASLWLVGEIWTAATGTSISGLSPNYFTTASSSDLALFRWIQGLHIIIAYGIPGLIWARAENVKMFSRLNFHRGAKPIAFVIGVLAIGSILPFIEYIHTSPENFSLPGDMKELEKQIVDLEKMGFEHIKAMIGESTVIALISNIIVIAVIPAVFEEIFFRGFLLQNLRRMMGVNLAVWISAFVFSFLHFQFLGFFPRMVLGAMLGYLVIWSGSIWPAIVGHFANNFINVLAARTQFDESTGQLDIEQTANVSMTAAIISCVVAIILMYFYRRQFPERREITADV